MDVSVGTATWQMDGKKGHHRRVLMAADIKFQSVCVGTSCAINLVRSTTGLRVMISEVTSVYITLASGACH